MIGSSLDSGSRRAALAVLGGLLAVSALALALPVVAPGLTDAAYLRSLLADFGPYAPVAFVALQTAQVVLAPIPGQLLGVVGGYLFGWALGTLYSVIGVTLGSYIVFRLARRYGRPTVERWVDDDVLARFDGVVERGGVTALFVVFLFPAFPDDAVCFIAGLTDIDMRVLVALVVVGRTPSFLLAATAGTELAAAQWTNVLAIAAVGGLASLAVYVFRDRIRARVTRGQ
jgi:uncharacterized membrane protein YdjX (TVP38/TMEM64 family)